MYAVGLLRNVFVRLLRNVFVRLCSRVLPVLIQVVAETGGDENTPKQGDSLYCAASNKKEGGGLQCEFMRFEPAA